MTPVEVGGAVAIGVFGALTFLIFITRGAHRPTTVTHDMRALADDSDHYLADLERQDKAYRDLYAAGHDPEWNPTFGWMTTTPSITQRIDEEANRHAAIITPQPDTSITVVKTTDPRHIRYVVPEQQFAMLADETIEFATMDGRTFKMADGRLVETTPFMRWLKTAETADLQAREADLVAEFDQLAAQKVFTGDDVREGQRLAKMIEQIREEIARRTERQGS